MQNVTGADLIRKFTVRFRPIRKEIVSSIYNNSNCREIRGREIHLLNADRRRTFGLKSTLAQEKGIDEPQK